jgi:hypothetical protein
MLEMSDGSVWYCRQFVSGASQTGELRRLTYAPVVGVPLAGGAEIALEPPQPSPSMGSAMLRWSQSQRGLVRLAVYDLGGRSVRTLRDGVVQDAGAHEQLWDGQEDSGEAASPGIYFARLKIGDAMRQVRITLLR